MSNIKIRGMPEGTTHVYLWEANGYPGGYFVITAKAYKQMLDGSMRLFDTDNDNEYPQWVPTDTKASELIPC